MLWIHAVVSMGGSAWGQMQTPLPQSACQGGSAQPAQHRGSLSAAHWHRQATCTRGLQRAPGLVCFPSSKAPPPSAPHSQVGGFMTSFTAESCLRLLRVLPCNLSVSASSPDPPLPPLRKRHPPQTRGRHPPRTSVSSTLSALPSA